MTKTILIADDNDTLRHALSQTLAHDSFEVCGEAHDGQDAIDKAQQLRPDLIILDISMPVMNGFDAARTLKQRFPSVPIILYTLHKDRFIEEEARAAGAAAVVSKSERVSVLMGLAHELLDRNAA
jgi:DNA-binding NarL/FixJ family response regulator